ncbi:MAG: PKD domain-containing protein [Candidatus Kapaibacterium sp.]
MHSIRILVCLMVAFILSQQAFAGNPDILWQKTLTADTLPIRSIAIAEGKYVAALKGNQIIILDYATGDSVTAFATPKEMYGNDIILGKGGERLYVFVGGQGSGAKSNLYLHSWNIATLQVYSNIEMSVRPSIDGFSSSYIDFFVAYSLSGDCICAGTTYQGGASASMGTGGVTRCFTTIDSAFEGFTSAISEQPTEPIFTSTSGFKPKNLLMPGNGGIYHLAVSHSGNYVLAEWKNYMEYYGSGHGKSSTTISANILGRSSPYKSYLYNNFIPAYTFSHNDDFLLSDNALYDLPPSRVLRTITKTGFAFLPDDNHLLAFKAGGGVAAISNIERDTWEKVFYGDSLTENLIQPGAKFASFVTASNARITLWKIPDTLQSALLTADFTMTNDTISLGDTVSFSNKTYPFKRGNMYQWHFGDSTASSAEIHPKHVFAQQGNYTILLQVRDTLGRISTISKSITVQNSTDVLEAHPLSSTALSITPNPSYGETQIHLTLSQASDYNVRIMDNLGREIARWDDHQSAGDHVILWNENVPSGVYYCTLSVGGEVRMVPFVVVR